DVWGERRAGLDLPRPGNHGRTRYAPSQFEFFSLRNGVMAASGQEFMCGPLSVEYITNVLFEIPRSSSALRTVPTFLSWSIIVSWYGLCHRPDYPTLSGWVWVRKCR